LNGLTEYIIKLKLKLKQFSLSTAVCSGSFLTA